MHIFLRFAAVAKRVAFMDLIQHSIAMSKYLVSPHIDVPEDDGPWWTDERRMPSSRHAA